MKSLREYTCNKADSFVDHLILEWKSKAYFGKNVVLVEGSTDEKLYNGLFSSNCCVKFTWGCNNLISYHEAMTRKWKQSKHIAIKDADFERANNTLKTIDGFFYTDCHDYEMMALDSDTVLQPMINNLGSTQNANTVRTQISNELHELSMLKWYNYTCHTNLLCSRGLDVLNEKIQNIKDYNYLISAFARQSKSTTATVTDCLSFVSANTSFCEEEITNGHDFINRFCGIVHGNSKKQNAKKVRELMDMHFTFSEFSKTDLYKSILFWQNCNRCIFVEQI